MALSPGYLMFQNPETLTWMSMLENVPLSCTTRSSDHHTLKRNTSNSADPVSKQTCANTEAFSYHREHFKLASGS